MKQKFALVQWVGGDYDKTYTAGVPVEWIMDFNADNFDPANESEDTSYVIKWRESKPGRNVKRGWKFYDAKVIRVSRRIQSLENQIKILEGAVSPLRPSPPDEIVELPVGQNLDLLYDAEAEAEGVASTSTSTLTSNRSTKRKGAKQNDDVEALLRQEGRKKKKQSERESNLSEEDDSIDEVVAAQSNTEGDQSVKQILLSLCQDMKVVKRVQLDMLKKQNEPVRQPDAPDGQVEIGHEGSNVFVTQRQWDTAISQSSYTTMGISLVRALFDLDVLLESNLRGGSSRIRKDVPRRPGLNPHIIAAIEEAVKNKFPDYKKFCFGAAINNFMTDLRRKNKAADNEQEIQGDE